MISYFRTAACGRSGSARAARSSPRRRSGAGSARPPRGAKISSRAWGGVELWHAYIPVGTCWLAMELDVYLEMGVETLTLHLCEATSREPTVLACMPGEALAFVTYTYMYIYTYRHIYVYIYIYICVCVYVCVCICIYIYIHMYVYTHCDY